MLDYKTVATRLTESQGIDSQAVIDFIAEMREAKTSLFYTEERMNRYRSLNIEEVRNMLSNNQTSMLKIGIIKGKMLRLKNTHLAPEAIYF